MSADPSSAEQKVVLDDLIRLLDISIDINTRMDDVAFGKEDGNEIIYVFDENIFEVFIDPSLHQFSVVSFHDQNWAPTSKSGERQFQDRANLLASESLLAGDLPGAIDDLFFMTGPHQKELGSRLERHSKDIARYSQEDYRKVAQEVRWKAELIDALDSGSPSESIFDQFSDRWLDRDEKLVSEKKGNRIGSLLRYARLLSSMFVKSKHSERIEQLNRIVTLGISSRLGSLEDRFDVKPDQDLIRSTSDWMQRLLDERDRRGGKAKRSKAGFSLDASSISIIQWISDNLLHAKQRIVLVTGDRLLYDVYRRWYCEEAALENIQRKFVLRRLSQFSPVMSTDELDSQHQSEQSFGLKTPNLAEEIRSTVEVSLLPFNLSLLRKNLASHQLDAIVRARHNMVLQYQQNSPSENVAIDYFIRNLNASYFADHKVKIKIIKDLWRKIERITISVYYENLVDRLRYRDRVFSGEKFAGVKTEEEYEAALQQVISSTADDLFNRLAEKEIPNALNFLEDLKARSFINTRRSPKSIWFQGRDGRSVTEQIGKWRKSESKNIGLLSEVWGADGFVPYDVFGLAAAFALFSHGWKEAQNFSSLAIRSGHAHGAGNEKLVEIEYMSCLAKRFLFADDPINFPHSKSDAPHDAVSRVTRLEETFSDVAGAMEEAKTACYEIADVHRKSLALCRLSLERSSLDLMHLVSLLGVNKGTNDKKGLEKRIDGSVARLLRVQNMLLECNDARKTDLQEQIDGTLAAAYVISFIATGKTLNEKCLGSNLMDRLKVAAGSLGDGDRPSYYLLTVLYAATQLIQHGPNQEFADHIAKAVKHGKTEVRRIRFDGFFEAQITDALRTAKLI